MEGYLLKWVNPFQRWQKRYFILNNDVLTYCEVKGGTAKGNIHLKVAGIAEVPNDPCRFIIHTGMNELILKTNTPQEQQQWVNQLRKSQEQCIRGGQINYEHQVDQILIHIWTTLAEFDQQLELLINAPNVTYLQQLGSQLRTYITQGCQIIEQEKMRIFGSSNTVYESFDIQSEMPKYQYESPDRRLKTEEHKNHDHFSLSVFLESIKHTQPVKYSILKDNQVFKKLHLDLSESRDSLPFKQDPNEKFHFWPFLKECIGKDLTRIPMPLVFHQPLSALQMIAQTFEYFDLIQKAVHCHDASKRMGYIIAFSLIRCLTGLECQKKYFNPVLGETYEYVTENYSIICEQVSHHPPITAIHCEGHDFKLWSQFEAIIGFSGTSIKVNFPIHINILLKKFDERYTYKLPEIYVKNLLFGRMYFEHVGEVKYFNHKNGDIGILSLKERNWDGNNSCNVNAQIRDLNGNIKCKLNGFWDKYLNLDDECIYTRIQPTTEQQWYYGYTHHTLQLNHLNKDILQTIPPTDSRLRSDVIALEHGWKQLGQEEKVRIEEKQRERRKIMEQLNQHHIPKYFSLQMDQLTKEQMYIYKDNYFQEKHIDPLDLF